MQSRLEILILTAIAIQVGSDRPSRCNCCYLNEPRRRKERRGKRGSMRSLLPRLIF
ncbi:MULTISPECIES: hypothetical protein [Cyanophyceae]|uniref:hypothetical protein n=1 Tax=Cyanophyceae TaxID=3028117 RepID=UPI0016831A01|nr:hypothetical protein [Trichocoleus sp. FACHB-69]MBD1933826.1 hypothetical protein [Trichocoleus sp. FACHB-69]